MNRELEEVIRTGRAMLHLAQLPNPDLSFEKREEHVRAFRDALVAIDSGAADPYRFEQGIDYLPPWQRIADIVSGLSEQIFLAGWMNDIEYMVWDVMEDPHSRFGSHVQIRNRTADLRLLAEQGGRWPVSWDVSVPLDEWTATYAKWKRANDATANT